MFSYRIYRHITENKKIRRRLNWIGYLAPVLRSRPLRLEQTRVLILFFALQLFPLTVVDADDYPASPALKDNCPLVLSYYWPVAAGFAPSLTHNDLSIVNAVDVLQPPDHGSPALYEAWRQQGMKIFSRAYPFRTYTTPREGAEYMRKTAGSAQLLTIDELIGHRWSSAKRLEFAKTLELVRRATPTMQIVLWDATDWDLVPKKYMNRVLALADTVILQRYIVDFSAPIDRHLDQLRTTVKFIGSTPVLKDRAILGIGLDPRSVAESTSTEYTNMERGLVASASFVAQQKLPGVAIYAPKYLSRKTLQRMEVELSDWATDC